MQKKVKKIIPYILVLLILVGLFSPLARVNAQSNIEEDMKAVGAPETSATLQKAIDSGTATATQDVEGLAGPISTESIATDAAATAAGGTRTDPNKSDFENEMANDSCMSVTSINPFSDGCIKKVVYFFFHDIPAFLLYVSAYFFNVLLSVSLSSDLLRSSFVGQAWGIVRDFSNIFFILILLYISIKVILGLGGTEVKKMIAKVVIIALLINFSMFFTQVIVDSSNILALIFYNKTIVKTKNPDSTERAYSGVGTEKDIAGGLVNSFDPTKMIGKDFFTQAAKKFDANGDQVPGTQKVPTGTMLAIILLSGAIMLVATYVFFISGFFFLGRLIELWILIIFSPFAFISSTVPQLSKVGDVGWEEWFKRLIAVSFMAPIFMFFLYFIFMLVASPIFGTMIPKSTTNDGITGMIKIILGVMLPSVLICVLLLKAKNYAKKGSGTIGEMVMTGAKMVGGLALGAAVGTAAVAGRATVGRAGAALANSEWAKRREAEGRFGSVISRNAFKAVGSGSFDARGAKIGGQTLASATGMKLGETQKGGFAERRKEQVEKRKNRAKELEVGEDEAQMQTVRQAETTLQNAKADPTTQANLLRLNEGDVATGMASLGQLERASTAADRALADAERTLRDAVAQFGAATPQADAARAVQATAVTAKNTARTNFDIRQADIRTTGGDIHRAEVALKETQNTVIGENRTRRVAYANTTQSGFEQTKNFIFSGGQHSFAGAREAAHKIRANIQETKA